MVEEILGGRTGFSSQPITMTGDNAIRFRNANHYIASLNANYLDIDAPSQVRFGTGLAGNLTGIVTSTAAAPADAGAIRLGNSETVSWRNSGGDGNIELVVNASNVLAVNTTLGLGGQDLTDLGMLNYDAETELTISGGTVAATQTVNRIDTENDDPSDDLDTVTGGTIGDILIFRPASDSRTVVVQHGGGVNGFRLNGSVNFTMDDAYTILQCIFTPNSEWQEISRSVS